MKATDRCDRCSAAAKVMTLHSGNALFWCGHHANKYAEWLNDFIVIDDREALTT